MITDERRGGVDILRERVNSDNNEKIGGIWGLVDKG